MLEKKDGILQNNVEEKNNMERPDVQPEWTQSPGQAKDSEAKGEDLKDSTEDGSHPENSQAIGKESADSVKEAAVDAKSVSNAQEGEVDQVEESVQPIEGKDVEGTKSDGGQEEVKDG